MTQAPKEWTKIASFSTGLEADLAMAALESAGILAVVRGHQRSGIFGAAFQGPIVGGVELQVPTARLDDAWEILTSMVPLADDPD